MISEITMHKIQQKNLKFVIIFIPNHTKGGEWEEEMGGDRRKYEEVFEKGGGLRVPRSNGPKVPRTKISQSHIQIRA